MRDLHDTLSSVVVERFTTLRKKIHDLADTLTENQLWQKPLPFGNSFGHLVLHLTGNLSYYIGAQMARTGYTRHRNLEFTDTNHPPKQETLERFDQAVDMVLQTVQAQSPEDWSRDYTGTGTDARSRIDIVVRCLSHMELHIGQMIYLQYALHRLPSAV
jgi:hypothetical protein